MNTPAADSVRSGYWHSGTPCVAALMDLVLALSSMGGSGDLTLASHLIKTQTAHSRLINQLYLLLTTYSLYYVY